METYILFLKKKPKQFLLMVLLSLLPATLSPLKVYFERLVFINVDSWAVGITRVSSEFNRLIIVVVIAQLLYVIVYPLFRCHVNYFGSELETILQNKLNEKSANIALELYEDPILYKNLETASSASRDLRFMVMMSLSELLLYVFQFIFILMIMRMFSPVLMLLGLFAVLPDVFTKFLQSRNTFKSLVVSQSITVRKDYYFKLVTSPQSVRELKVQNTCSFFKGLWEQKKAEFDNEQEKLLNKNLILDGLCGSVNLFFTIATYLVLIMLFRGGDIDIGAFAASLGAVQTLKSNFWRFVSLLLFSVDCGMKGKFFYKVIDYPDRKGVHMAITPKEGIEMKGVSFGYKEGVSVLNNISVRFKRGEIVAIVGENGMGKTTFVKTLLGMYKPLAGDVLYSGIRTNDVDEFCVYRESSAVMQDFGKYHLSVLENITIADSRSEFNRGKGTALLETLEFRQSEKPDVDGKFFSLDTPLGREFGGAELSGGNWQKLAIARGFYKPHELMIFDEPTAALDPLIEEKVLTSVLAFSPGKLKIFVTHRLNLAKSADHIIVIKKGTIIEYGTHDELLSQNAVYANMWQTQAQWYRR
jgi:ATP-binding cassette subfamily B protein